MQKPIKKALTLIEVMIVILIIGIIGSVVGYNMKGSLDKAKVFKTEQGAKKLYELALLGLEEMNVSLAEIKEGELLQKIDLAIRAIGIGGKTATLMRDGWGEPFTAFAIVGGILQFRSEKYDAYCLKTGRERRYPWENELEEPKQQKK
ncbi:MAG: prepilin-type N-terminal cleavage/methylation domain-containing protein [Simkania negevensis]|nr:prepilin-type N-terminal cleavage/methylation domain-containing protein [Simkania negevensis]